MLTRDGRPADRRSRRVPIVTVGFLVVALGVAVLLASGAVPEPSVWGGVRLPVLVLLVPPLLAFAGSAAALRDREVGATGRLAWSFGSAVVGVLSVPALWAVVVLVDGP